MSFTEEKFGKIRVHVVNGSYLDVWLSRKMLGRYAYHWERRHIDGSIYRYDNRPHERLRLMKTYPRHFHDTSEHNVKESHISDDPEKAVREVLELIRRKVSR